MDFVLLMLFFLPSKLAIIYVILDLILLVFYSMFVNYFNRSFSSVGGNGFFTSDLFGVSTKGPVLYTFYILPEGWYNGVSLLVVA